MGHPQWFENVLSNIPDIRFARRAGERRAQNGAIIIHSTADHE